MYCTKCGANLPRGAARCPQCGAQPLSRRQDPKPAPYKRPALIALGCAAVLVAIAAGVEHFGRAESAPGPQLVESANSPATSAPAAASAGLSGANLMFLPKANLSFVGDWGGHLRIQGAAAENANVALKVVPASFYFGEKNGLVYLKTNLYGDPKWSVVKTAVKVIDPQSVEFSVDSFCKTCTPPQSQQQVTRLTLIGSSQLDAKVYSHSAAPGGAHGEMTYAGTLHLLTPAELDAIDREVQRDGKFMAKVNSKVPVNN
jgi:zinc-ribbon domain